MLIPIIGVFIPVWLILMVVVVVLVGIFDRDLLHLFVVAGCVYLAYWLYKHFF